MDWQEAATVDKEAAGGERAWVAEFLLTRAASLCQALHLLEMPPLEERDIILIISRMGAGVGVLARRAVGVTGVSTAAEAAEVITEMAAMAATSEAVAEQVPMHRMAGLAALAAEVAVVTPTVALSGLAMGALVAEPARAH